MGWTEAAGGSSDMVGFSRRRSVTQVVRRQKPTSHSAECSVPGPVPPLGMPQHVKVDASGFQSAEWLTQHVLATRTRNRGSSRPSGRTGGAVAL